jgi:hypothetical protein
VGHDVFVGRWVGSVLDPAYLPAKAHDEDKDDRENLRMLARLKQQRAIHELLGAPVLFDTTTLIAPHGEWIGECKVGGRKVTWSMWAPHKRMLLDIFPKALPPREELEGKEAFCTSHNIRYLVVPPTHSLDLEDLREALAKEA